MATFSTVDCNEKHGTRKENMAISESPFDASVVLECTWGNRAALVNDLLLTPQPWPYAAAGGITPYAVRCSVMPAPTTYTQADQGITYTNAEVTVYYSANISRYSDEEDPPTIQIYSESIEPDIEFNTVPNSGKSYFFDTSNIGVPARPLPDPESIIEENFPVAYPSFNLRLVRTLYHLAAVPTTALTSINKINATDYTSSTLGLTFPAKTLLFEPPTLQRSISTAGSDGWTCTAKFHYRQSTWEKFWNPKSAAFEYIRSRRGPGFAPFTPFQTADFSDWLF